MAGTVLNMVEVVLGESHHPVQSLHDFQVVFLTVGANQVGFTQAAFLNNGPHSSVVVMHMNPVAHIQAIAVQARAHPVDAVCNHAGNELFHVLIRAIVV